MRALGVAHSRQAKEKRYDKRKSLTIFVVGKTI